MKARIQWAGEALFLGESGSGHALVMDGPPEAGGRNLGVRPMEMILLGLGGCSNYDVVSILRKSRQPVESCEAFVEAERADEDPKVFTKIHLHFVVKGGAQGGAGQACCRAVCGKILFGFDHARPCRRCHQPRLRDHRAGLSVASGYRSAGRRAPGGRPSYVYGRSYRRYVLLVMTLDSRVMPNLTGAGKRRPPASRAVVACCSSSSRICSRMARDL